MLLVAAPLFAALQKGLTVKRRDVASYTVTWENPVIDQMIFTCELSHEILNWDELLWVIVINSDDE